jgi:hypothetical protein
MFGTEKSDSPIVPVKGPNHQYQRVGGDSGGRRGWTLENIIHGDKFWTQSQVIHVKAMCAVCEEYHEGRIIIDPPKLLLSIREVLR